MKCKQSLPKELLKEIKLTTNHEQLQYQVLNIYTSLITTLVLIANIVAAVSFSASPSTSTSAQKQQVTITAALDYLGDAKII